MATLVVGLAACGDDPFDFDWTDTPGVRDTVLLYSLARPELGLESGFSFVPRPAPSVIEAPNATGTWDMALDTRGGELVLLPPGSLGITSRARISPLGPVAFDDVVEAPEDTLLYVADDPVSVAAGSVYIVRTNRTAGTFGSSCLYYAKMEPLTIDVAGGTLLFRYVASPICNSRDLTPPD
jgi:hypothetical protein